MMDTFSSLGDGLLTALTPETLMFALIGVFLGTVVSVLPGIGPITAIAILIPVSFGMEPVHGLIMLCAVYYGSMFGSSITSTLIRTPGEVASVVTVLDGYEMTQQGRARAALATAAIGSLVGGILTVLALTFLSPLFIDIATLLGASEYFLLMTMALLLASSMSSGSSLKALIAVLIGLAVGMIGLDLQTGLPRQTFGLVFLRDGIDFVIFAMALFAIPEAIRQLASKSGAIDMGALNLRSGPWMTRDDWRRSGGPWARGSVLGFVVGVLPGVGPSLASFMAYLLEKKIAKKPQRFGRGAIEGVAAPEAANSAGVGGAMVPLLTLGVPGSATTALLLFVFIMYGLQPGPTLFTQESPLIWTIIASMFIGNVALVALNLPLIGVFVRLLKIPPEILFSTILALVAVGTYSIKFSLVGLLTLGVFGVIGYLMNRADIPLAPSILAVVLAPLLEDNFRRMLQISGGSFEPLVTRPLSLTFLLLIIAGIVGPLILKFVTRPTRAARGLPNPQKLS